jgi:two-component system cell cycle sensor histidine kinase PleC
LRIECELSSRMVEITAQMIERGRGATDPKTTAQKRKIAYKVREAREALTSAGSGHRAFDVELLRHYAAGRKSAGLVMSVASLAIAFIAIAWAPPNAVFIWMTCVVAGLACIHVMSSRLEGLAGADVDVRKWRRRVILTETAQSMLWAGVVLLVLPSPDPDAQHFVLIVLLLLGAMSALITATVPGAVYAALAPIALAIAFASWPSRLDATHLLLAALTYAALLYFVVLATRLYETWLENLSFQAEKDGLIAELEQAKANSDEARRRAEEASLAKSRFLATMSHELRTPLNAILGFSEVMKGELFGAHSVPAYREYSNDIHSSGQHLLALINEILDLSRIEAGRNELREESIVLASIVEDCNHLLAMRARKRDIAISYVAAPDLPRLWADERAVRQVVLNLLTNAIKFTPQGGSVTIKIGWTQAGGQYFSVRDTGPGIPESEIPIVMSSFGRSSLSQKNAEEGSGLGLPIVKGLVEQHGGTFTLRSKVREGTEVIVVFPPERVMNALPRLDENSGARRAVARSRAA